MSKSPSVTTESAGDQKKCFELMEKDTSEYNFDAFSKADLKSQIGIIHEHKCKYCTKIFSNSSLLTCHMITDHPVTKCNHCNTKFYDRMEFVNHFKTCGKAKVLFGCKICQKTFGTRHDFFNHSKVCYSGRTEPMDPPQVNLSDISYSFNNPAVSDRSNSVNDSIETQSGSMDEENLENQVTIFNGTCHVCKKRFYSQESLKFHMKKAHFGAKLPEQTMVKLNYMGTLGSFPRKDLRIMKTNVSAAEICDQCGKSYNSKAGLNSHIRRLHQDDPNDSLADVETRPNIPDSSNDVICIEDEIRPQLKSNHKWTNVNYSHQSTDLNKELYNCLAKPNIPDSSNDVICIKDESEPQRQSYQAVTSVNYSHQSTDLNTEVMYNCFQCKESFFSKDSLFLHASLVHNV